MSATYPAANSGTHATQPPRLRMDVIDDILEARGIHTDIAKAAAMGIDRASLHRWRRGQSVSLSVAMSVAQILDRSIDDIVTRAA
jgi:Cro/C1-type HTH DNA-binding domain